MSDKKEWVSFEELGVTDNSVRLLTELLNGPYVGKNPLTDIPDPQITLYGIEESAFFDTYEEAEKYAIGKGIKTNGIKTYEYLGDVAGRKRVVRKTNIYGKTVLLAPVDSDGYGIYNEERSIWQGKYIWEYFHGSINNIYRAFESKKFKDEVEEQRSVKKPKLTLL